MELKPRDEALLNGEFGAAPQAAMELLVAVAEAEDAPRFIEISGAHIDGCLYHGLAGVEFVEWMVAMGGSVAVPTTLNVSSLDLLHPDLYRGDSEVAALSKRLMEAHTRLGAVPTWTCAPYQLPDPPSLGAQIAWGESNAIVFANSVLGARTARYGDFTDLCCSLTGRAPMTALHTDEGRLATMQVSVQIEPSRLDDDLTYVLIGHLLGQIAGTEVVAISGLDQRATKDRLKALGAAAASSGAVAMFHVLGVTPEATDFRTAFGDRGPLATTVVGASDLERAWSELDRSQTEITAVSVGTPHMSIEEMRRLAALVQGSTARMPFYVNLGRDVLMAAEQQGLVEILETFGATLVTDTCTYVTQIMADPDGSVMTNSGKWAYYAPANLGFDVALGNLDDCVATATRGRRSSRRP